MPLDSWDYDAERVDFKVAVGIIPRRKLTRFPCPARRQDATQSSPKLAWRGDMLDSDAAGEVRLTGLVDRIWQGQDAGRTNFGPSTGQDLGRLFLPLLDELDVSNAELSVIASSISSRSERQESRASESIASQVPP